MSLDDIAKRRASTVKRYERKKERIEEEEFVNQLRMFAVWTPSLEFIPDCKDFLKIMKEGMGERERGFEAIR